MTFEELNSYIAGCGKCGLCKTRHNVVIGKGSHSERGILLVGEGPGEQEDLQGSPFVGQAGRLLDMALDAVAIDRNALYIANIVKCRPPENRNPLPEEVEACMPYLRAQFSLLKPMIVVAMGAVASKSLKLADDGITKVRGQWIERGGTLFLPTYHPAALLRNSALKIDFYRDLTAVKEKYDSLITGSES